MELPIIAKLQAAINQGIQFTLPLNPESKCSSVMLHLLNLTRNCVIYKYTHLIILQKLTYLISLLVPFDTPICHLARLDRKQFRKDCGKSAKNMILESMTIGIYPPKKATKSIEDSITLQMDLFDKDYQEIGNKNWKLTRKIIFSYHKSAPKEHQECLKVLLALPQLRDQKYMMIPWRSLWTELYLMTNSILLSQNQNFELKQERQNQLLLTYFTQALDHTLQSHKQTQQIAFIKAILKLIGFLVKKIVFKKIGNDLKELDMIFTLLRQHNFAELYTYLISFMLIKDIFQKLGLKEASEHYKQKLNSFINQSQISRSASQIDIQFVQNQSEAILLRSYLMDAEKLPDFLFRNGLNFWEYGLMKQETEILAERYLLKSQRLNDNFDWEKVFQHLSPVFFEKHILKAGEKWVTKKWAYFLFQTNDYRFMNRWGFLKINNQTNLQLLKVIFKQFCSQWYLFSKVDKINLKRSIHQVESLLTFNFNFNEKLLRYFVFPQENSTYFVSLLQGYLRLVTQQGLFDEKYHLFFRSELADNLSRIENHLLDQYWSLWADILINKHQTLYSLLKIQDKQKDLLTNQTVPNRNGSLYLKPN